MKKNVLVGLLAVSLLVAVTGCENSVFSIGDNNELKSSKIMIEKDKAKALDLELNIGAGELNVNGGSKDWAAGKVEYNRDVLKPKVSYELHGDKGSGVIEQKSVKLHNIKRLENHWDLNLNQDIPTDLTVHSGATKTKLNLEGLNLSGLDVKTGVGDVTIDLGGNWEKSFEASFEMGVGKSTIILPSDVGVKIISSKGIGKTEFVGLISKGNGVYVNQAYEHSDVVITIKTDLGVGETTFKLEK